MSHLVDLLNNFKEEICLKNLFCKTAVLLGTAFLLTSSPVFAEEKYDPFAIQVGGTGGRTAEEARKNLGIKEAMLDIFYPVGSIYMSMKLIDPNVQFGGKWVRWGEGRVPVGVASSGTFNTVRKTGGSENVTLSVSNMPIHEGHVPPEATSWGDAGGRTTYYMNTYNNTNNFMSTNSSYPNKPYVINGTNEYCLRSKTEGGGTAHSNLQPYITCYMWERES